VAQIYVAVRREIIIVGQAVNARDALIDVTTPAGLH